MLKSAFLQSAHIPSRGDGATLFALNHIFWSKTALRLKAVLPKGFCYNQLMKHSTLQYLTLDYHRGTVTCDNHYKTTKLEVVKEVLRG